MSEINEILKEIKVIRARLNSFDRYDMPSLTHAELSEELYGRIQALLSSHCLIDKETAQEAGRACVESEFLHQSAVIQLELSRLSTTHKGK